MGAVLLGFAADRAFGDPARLHPVAGFGRVAASVERWVWRPSRIVGAVYAAALVGSVGWVVRRWRRAPLAAAVLWATLGGRSLGRAALAMQSAL
jgi:adenosylcobinamide-phosphate synthase